MGSNTLFRKIWSTVAILYLAMTFTISQIVAYMEKRFRTGDEA